MSTRSSIKRVQESNLFIYADLSRTFAMSPRGNTVGF